MRPAPAVDRRGRLILLRHGQSEWNARNLFAGWENVPLTTAGVQAAARAGRLLAESGLRPDVVHTSLQQRAISTAQLVLAACDRDWIPVRRSWRLNSNHYGALQGRNKDKVRDQVGERQFMTWRRSYDTAPPPIDDAAAAAQAADPRYAALPPEARPRTESLRDVTARLLPYWDDVIIPDLHAGRRVLVVSHGNTLRALLKYLDRISDEQVMSLNVPTARPLVYDLDADACPHIRGGRYLGQPGSG